MHNFWLYCKKTWLKALKVKTWAHVGPLHQGPWKASYAPAYCKKFHTLLMYYMILNVVKIF